MERKTVVLPNPQRSLTNTAAFRKKTCLLKPEHPEKAEQLDQHCNLTNVVVIKQSTQWEERDNLYNYLGPSAIIG